MNTPRAPGLKLAKLLDRSPVKMTIALNPSLHAKLQKYAELYRQTYGVAEPLAELIPYMLANFIEGDKGFTRANRSRTATTLGE